MNKVIIGVVGKHYESNKKRTDTYIRDEVNNQFLIMEALQLEYYLNMKN